MKPFTALAVSSTSAAEPRTRRRLRSAFPPSRWAALLAAALLAAAPAAGPEATPPEVPEPAGPLSASEAALDPEQSAARGPALDPTDHRGGPAAIGRPPGAQPGAR
jgi:hypothetical protein